jgi:outer membrane lipoprotein-sorting protein
MKRFLTLILLAAVSTGAIAQTADEVISKFLEASGGKEKLSGINTLQYNQLIRLKTPMGELEMPLKYFKEKDKLFRLQTSLQFGPQSMEFYTVINDKDGFVMVPANPMMGLEGGLQKMSEKDRTQQLYQMDAAGLFSTLVDYAAKGHKVELLKDEKVNKEECFKVKHTLSNGQEITYFINKATNLVVRMDAKGAMAASMSGMGTVMSGMGGGGRVDKMEVSTLYSAYKDFDGIMFPTKVTIKSAMGDLESEINNIRINKTIDPALYKAQ